MNRISKTKLANMSPSKWSARKISKSNRNRYIHDNEGEFLDYNFQRATRKNGVQSVPTTLKHSQANSICKRMHQTIEDPQENINTANQMIDNALATATHALQ